MSMCDSLRKLQCRGTGWALLVARLVVAASFIIHGMAKWAMWSAQPSEQLSAGMINLMKFLSIVEPLGGVALIVGFLTSFAAGGLALIMLGAIYFKQIIWHISYTTTMTTGWELDLALFALALMLVCAGPGRLALDYVMCRKFCKHDGKDKMCVPGCCCKE